MYPMAPNVVMMMGWWTKRRRTWSSIIVVSWILIIDVLLLSSRGGGAAAAAWLSKSSTTTGRLLTTTTTTTLGKVPSQRLYPFGTAAGSTKTTLMTTTRLLAVTTTETTTKKASTENMEQINLILLDQPEENQQHHIDNKVRRSLAADYLVEIQPSPLSLLSAGDMEKTNVELLQETWTLISLEQFQNNEKEDTMAPGALATSALYHPHSSSSSSTTFSSSSSSSQEKSGVSTGMIVLTGRVELMEKDREQNQKKTIVFSAIRATTNQNDNKRESSPINNNDKQDATDLLLTLSRVMAQRLLSQYYDSMDGDALGTDDTKITAGEEWHLQLPNNNEEQKIWVKKTRTSDNKENVTINNDDNLVLQLFSISTSTTTTTPLSDIPELVEMVCSQGQPIGKLPRNFIHTFNILHRGIGLFVTKDHLHPHFHQTETQRRSDQQDDEEKIISDSVFSSSSLVRFPDLYVHRRTSWKRIFPSLYDMFVGGISLAGEDATTTALREVSEELGLKRPLALSEPLLACTICTSYNRCVVTLFCYVMDTSIETISWQQEVAWGDFVPYSVVEVAADLSMQRLAQSKTWPGSYPLTLSGRSNAARTDDAGDDDNRLRHDEEDWTKWDFVPDGLLVWEAWLRYLQDVKSKLG